MERGADEFGELLAAVHEFLLPVTEEHFEEVARARAADLLEALDGREKDLKASLEDRRLFVQGTAGLVLALIQWLKRRNQFVTVSKEARSALVKLMANSLSKILVSLSSSSARLEERLADVALDHGGRLDEWMERWLGGLPKEVPCAEYSPELQLSVLGIEPSTLRGPVLDLGCGASAALVEYLRARGIDAQGIDPLGSSDWVVGRDWLTFDYEEGTWGTILSHQGFSLHFLHHHLLPGDAALRYGQAYVKILRALRPGGSFVYVPSLPFIEAHLPKEEFTIVRRALPEELAAGFDWVRKFDPDLDVAHTSEVRRLEPSGSLR